MVTDPISDMLTRIRNASAVHKETVVMPYSKFKMAIANILFKEGIIKKVEHRGKKAKKTIEITIVSEGENQISGIKRVSKPSLRVYKTAKELQNYIRKKGITLVSTPRGVLTAENAKKENVGGEIICRIW